MPSMWEATTGEAGGQVPCELLVYNGSRVIWLFHLIQVGSFLRISAWPVSWGWEGQVWGSVCWEAAAGPPRGPWEASKDQSTTDIVYNSPLGQLPAELLFQTALRLVDGSAPSVLDKGLHTSPSPALESRPIQAAPLEVWGSPPPGTTSILVSGKRG